MSPSIEPESIIDGVEQNRKSHHDTIYVTEAQFKRLKKHAPVGGLHTSSIDSLRIAGLDVESLPRTIRPIVCQRGEVFPLAKDWKNGDCQHE